MKSLNRQDFINARFLLDSYYFAPHDMEFQYFMEGLIYIEKGDSILAEEAFSKSVILNKEFWPSAFQLGLAQKRNNKDSESRKTFSKCAESINSYLKTGKSCYNAFVGSFSPEYFLVLCNNYMNGV